MVCSQNDDHIIFLITDLLKPIGANLAGEYISGMRNNDGNWFFNFNRQSILKKFFDGASQLGRGFRIELSRDSGFTNISVRTFIRLASRGKTKNDDKQCKIQS